MNSCLEKYIKKKYKSSTNNLLLLGVLIISFFSDFNFPDGHYLIKEIGFGILSALLLFILLGDLSESKQFHINIIDVLMLMLFVWKITHLILINPTSTESAIFTNISLLIAYFYSRQTSFKCIEQVVFLCSMIITALVFHVCIGLLQHLKIIESLHPKIPITGTFFNSGPFSIFLTTLTLFTLTLFYYDSKLIDGRLKKTLILIIVFVAAFLIVKTESRTCWITIFLFITFLLTYKYKSYLKNRELLVILAISILLILFIPALYELKPNSAKGRLLIWQVTANIINDNILFGVGEGNFPFHYINQQRTYFKSELNGQTYGTLASDVRYAFNDFLQTFAEFGIIGFFIYIAILLLSIKFGLESIKRQSNDDIKLVNIAIYVMFINLVVSSLFSYIASLLLFKYLMVAVVGLLARGNVLFNLKLSINTKKPILLCAFVLTISIISHNIELLLCVKKWSNCVILSDQKKLKILTDMRPRLKSNGYFLYYLGKVYAQNKMYRSAIKSFKEAKLLYPDREVYIELASSYIYIGEFVLAEKEYISLKEAYPFNKEIQQTLANFHILFNSRD